MITDVNENNYKAEVEESGMPVLLDFFAERCGPCRMMERILEEAADERNDIKFCRINVDHAPLLSGRFGVMSTPTIVIVYGSKSLASAVGARPRAALDAMIDGAIETCINSGS